MSGKDDTPEKDEADKALAKAERSQTLETDKRIRESQLESGVSDASKDKPQPNVNPDG